MSNFVIIVTGVMGSGKSTVGQQLARSLGCSFFDGDDFHSENNYQKMVAKIPLTDEDRRPWLESINAQIQRMLPHESLVFACSALKEKYRQQLAENIPAECLHWVHLHGQYDTIKERVKDRDPHFMPLDLLDSQFQSYEKTTSGYRFDVAQPVDQIVNAVIEKVKTKP